MPVSQETVTVSNEMRAVGKHLVSLVNEGKKIAADGKVTFDEVPMALSAVIRDLIPAIAAVNALPAAAKENLDAFLTAAMLDVRDLVVTLVK